MKKLVHYFLIGWVGINWFRDDLNSYSFKINYICKRFFARFWFLCLLFIISGCYEIQVINLSYDLTFLFNGLFWFFIFELISSFLFIVFEDNKVIVDIKNEILEKEKK